MMSGKPLWEIIGSCKSAAESNDTVDFIVSWSSCCLLLDNLTVLQLQGVEEPQRKYFWPAALVHHSEDDDDDDDEEQDDEDVLLTVRNCFSLA